MLIKTGKKPIAIKKPDKAKEEKPKFDVTKNRHLDNGKIHVENLYMVFEKFRTAMNGVGYGNQNPFLQERKTALVRQELKKDLIEMGFEDHIDFSFIPMPPVITVASQQADKKAKEEAEAKAKKSKKRQDEDEEDEEDED